MLDHPRSAIAGLSLILKFGIDPIYSFGDIVWEVRGARCEAGELPAEVCDVHGVRFPHNATSRLQNVFIKHL